MINLTVDWLPQTAYLYMLVFARVGTLLMFMPAIGAKSIPARLRLSFALMLSLILYPLVSTMFPAMPAGLLQLVAPLGHEIAVGLILGGIMRLVVAALETAGATIAFQTGLSFAYAADPNADGQQGAMIGNFLSMLGVALIFATNLHHIAIAGIYDSYTVLPPSASLMFGDAAHAALDTLAKAFVIGIQISAPFIVFGLIFYMGLGILSRLMPQIQVFFIAMPANIAIGIILVALLLTMMMGWYLDHYSSQLNIVLRGLNG